MAKYGDRRETERKRGKRQNIEEGSWNDRNERWEVKREGEVRRREGRGWERGRELKPVNEPAAVCRADPSLGRELCKKAGRRRVLRAGTEPGHTALIRSEVSRGGGGTLCVAASREGGGGGG